MGENKRKSSITTNVDINLENDFVTKKAAVNMLLSIAKFLLFNRNQIPFVYETFHFMTKKLETAKSMQHGKNAICDSFVRSYAMERQRDIAIQTYRKFNEISNVLISSFEKCDIDQAIIMFGATPFTTKEAFFVHLPTVTRNHFAANHPNAAETICRKVIRSIVTSKSFFDLNCNELRPTNMYVAVKPKLSWNTMGDQYKSHNSLRLPASCRITHINIQNGFNAINLNCCQNLHIFSDSNASNSESTAANVKKSKTEPAIDMEKCPSDCNNFYECKVVVKGFKDQLVKGQSIWMHNVSL